MSPSQPERDDDEVSDSEDECTSSATESGAESSASTASRKKKKKKKNKKKKGSAGTDGEEQQQQHQPAAVSKEIKQACEKKFQAAMASIKLQDDLWLNLSASLIQDGKLEKLLEQLKDNTSITSIDLSGNRITDAGAQAIGSMLNAHRAAPELIALDLRDNNLGPAGLECLAQLKKHRSQLDIKTGSIDEHMIINELPELEGEELKEVTKGPMFRKFFQGPNEQQEEEPSSTAQEESQVDLPDISPSELWSRVTQLVKQGQSSIAELALSLQELAAILQHELSNHTNHKETERLLKSDSHAKACLAHLATLSKVMALSPPEVAVQYSPQVQPAVGSHRVWTSAVVALLLTHGSNAIDKAVSSSQLATQVVDLALKRPLCNALHTKALHVLHACVNSQEDKLLSPMLEEQSGKEASATRLLDVLIDMGTAAVDVECGKRSPLLGFVIGASRILQGMCNDPPGSAIKSKAVKRALQENGQWATFVKPESGALSKLCDEQDAELGGPRPSAPSMQDFSGDLGGGGGLMSSQDILALIESMNMGGGGQ